MAPEISVWREVLMSCAEQAKTVFFYRGYGSAFWEKGKSENFSQMKTSTKRYWTKRYRKHAVEHGMAEAVSCGSCALLTLCRTLNVPEKVQDTGAFVNTQAKGQSGQGKAAQFTAITPLRCPYYKSSVYKCRKPKRSERMSKHLFIKPSCSLCCSLKSQETFLKIQLPPQH